MRPLRVLGLMHEQFVPPDSYAGVGKDEVPPWKMEYDVMAGLHNLGHHTRSLGVSTDLAPIRSAIEEFKPHIVFNMLEEFGELGTHGPFVLAYLELMGQAYTGCNPRGMLLADDKTLVKKICKYHRIHTPDFLLYPRSRVFKPPRKLSYPLIVKTATEHGSVGIAQASVVNSEDKLRERVGFIHDSFETDALVEEYIEGRELYVGVLGNHRVQTFPIWELHWPEWPEGVPKIATSKLKWDHQYQAKVGVKTRPATDLDESLTRRILHLCRRAYRLLGQSGYARIDLRLRPDGEIYLLESNPNPQLAFGEDFAESAHAAGLDYESLLQRIVQLGLRYHANGRA